MAESPSRKSQKQPTQWATKNTKRLAPLEEIPSSPLITNLGTTSSIQSRKELIDAVRRTNPASLKTAPGAFWDVEGSIKTTTIDDSTVKQQLNIVENGVNYSARRYNDLKIANEGLTKDLKRRLDELDEQRRNFESLDAMKKAETEESARIESLHEEIAKVEDEIDQKVHYSRQLDHLLLRLRKNQLKFDAHMVGMEQTMANIQKEGADIRLLRKSLDVGLARAVIVLDETKANLACARKDREVMMAKRRSEIKNAEMLQEWLHKREAVKAALVVELRGDLTREEETFLRTQISEKVEETKFLQKANEDSTKKLQAMEDIFAQLKQVTGVSALDDMLEKFSCQKNNKRDLEAEVKEAEARLAAAKKAMQRKEKEFQELKSSGVGQSEMSREMTEKLNADILIARNEFKLTKAMTDRLSAVLLGLQQGSNGLLQRVGPYLHLADVGVFDLTKAEDEQFWQSTLESLSTVEQVLAKMLESVSGTGGDNNSNSMLKSLTYEDGEGEDDGSSQADLKSSTGTLELTVGANNIRVKSRKSQKDLEAFKSRDDDITEKEIPTNHSIDSSTLAEEGAAGGANGGATNTNKGNTNPTAGNGGGTNGSDDVPNRLTVKKSSDRTTSEFIRRAELEAKRKRLQERMALGRSAAAGTENDIDGLAAYKAQKAAAARLCTIQSIPTLPEGVKLRDDVMTKTQAFLTKMPNLA